MVLVTQNCLYEFCLQQDTVWKKGGTIVYSFCLKTEFYIQKVSVKLQVPIVEYL